MSIQNIKAKVEVELSRVFPSRINIFFATLTALTGITNANAIAIAATFTTYNGGVDAELEWQLASGKAHFDSFESYLTGEQIASLPTLGLEFKTLAGGGLPNIYRHHQCCVTPYGPKHLGNFPNGVNQINRWDNIVVNVLPEYKVTALGFWNGDGQYDTLFATAYDTSNNILGLVGAFRGSFAGFISDVEISRVIFDGNTGDGWNHLDGLQTNALVKPTSIPEASSKPGLFLLALLIFLGLRRKP
jgi:hypothetical protein